MMNKYLLAFALLIFSASIAHGGDIITVRADVWEPYNNEDPDSSTPGYMIDVAKAIFTKVLKKPHRGELTESSALRLMMPRTLSFLKKPLSISR
jgi:hypothetical protein